VTDAIGYIRTSLEDSPRSSEVLRDQERVLKGYCAQAGLMPKVYRDQGASGETLLGDRPGGAAFLQHLKRQHKYGYQGNEVWHAVTPSLDRLFWNLDDALYHITDWTTAPPLMRRWGGSSGPARC
jgi:DNA invertase Pin-like site-specific DNA recombinase